MFIVVFIRAHRRRSTSAELTGHRPPPSRAAGVPPRTTHSLHTAAKALPPACAAHGQRLQIFTDATAPTQRACFLPLFLCRPLRGTALPQVAMRGRQQPQPASRNPIASQRFATQNPTHK